MLDFSDLWQLKDKLPLVNEQANDPSNGRTGGRRVMAQATIRDGQSGAEPATASQATGPSEEGQRPRPFLRLVTPISSRHAADCGLSGGFLFVVNWEAGHSLTPAA